MTDVELERRIGKCREDYTRVTGKCNDYFFCPILRKDEKSELIRGHIVNSALVSSNKWVPQRKDVDGFFGSVIEPEFISVIQDRERDPFEIWFNRQLRKKHHPKLMLRGECIDHYFPKDQPPAIPGHSRLIVTDNSETPICNISLKISRDRILDVSDGDLELVLERDYRPAVIGALLKAAHLTLFSIIGYRYVISATGLWPADILRQFFLEQQGKHGVAEDVVERFFITFERMIAPFSVANDTYFRGSIEDNMFLTLRTGKDNIFSIGVIVRAGQDRFCVFLPTDSGPEIDTYFSFLNEPPESVRARGMWFRPSEIDDGGFWESDNLDMRIPIQNCA